MVDLNNPVINEQVNRMVAMLWHTVDGFYIWEFFTTLDYEWSVIRGRRPYRWTIWVYSLTRVAALLTVILDMVHLDVTGYFDCQVGASMSGVCLSTPVPSIVICQDRSRLSRLLCLRVYRFCFVLSCPPHHRRMGEKSVYRRGFTSCMGDQCRIPHPRFSEVTQCILTSARQLHFAQHRE